jgi:predicted TIM-barrel fold metal-dependent hydrolase
MADHSSIVQRQKSLFGVDEAWLAQYTEPALEPDLPIVDPHHHLWDRGGVYMRPEYGADIATGHNIRASVFVQCDAMYNADADPAFAPVGETEFVNGIAAQSASGQYGPSRIAAGIVGFADLFLGARVDPVLEAHIHAAPARFRGIRTRSVWDADSSIKGSAVDCPPGLLLDTRFRAGFARLAKYGLSFDSWLFHPQVPELADLAAKFADTTIILDHIGAPLGVGVYAGKGESVFADWKRNMSELARQPNVNVKLGGLGMHLFAFGLDPASRPRPATSEEIAKAWKPYIETVIELFGVNRCMFESNFPVDKRVGHYPVIWNAFKRIAARYSAEEKAALFKETACRAYRLAI